MCHNTQARVNDDDDDDEDGALESSPPCTSSSLLFFVLHFAHLPSAAFSFFCNGNIADAFKVDLSGKFTPESFCLAQKKKKGDDVRNTLYRLAQPKVTRRLQETKADAALPQLLQLFAGNENWRGFGKMRLDGAFTLSY